MRRLRPATCVVLLAAAMLAGCSAGPIEDADDAPQAGYDTQTGRPPPGAPNDPLYPERDAPVSTTPAP